MSRTSSRWTPLLALCCLALFASVASASVRFHGLQASSLGVATADVDGDGFLSVSNIGSSGQDGVSFDCLHMDGARVVLDGDCDDTDDDGLMAFTYRWTLLSQPGSSRAASLSCRMTPQGFVVNSHTSAFDFAPAQMTVSLMRDGAVVYRCVVPSSTDILVAKDATGRCPMPSFSCRLAPPPPSSSGSSKTSKAFVIPHVLEKSGSFSRSVHVSVAGHDDDCDGFVVGEVCDPADVDEDCDGLSSDLRVSAPPSSHLVQVRCSDGSCRALSHWVSGSGQSDVLVARDALGNSRSLLLQNIGSSGQDGVSVTLDRSVGSLGSGGGGGGGAVLYRFSPPSLHFDPAVDNGRSCSISVVGLSFECAGATSCPVSASCKITVTGSNFCVSPDHSGMGADVESVAVLDHGVEVGRCAMSLGSCVSVTAPPGGSPQCAVTGSGVKASWNLKENVKAPFMAGRPAGAFSTNALTSSSVDLSRTCPISTTFSSSRVFLIGGLSFVGNEVVCFGGQSSDPTGHYSGSFVVVLHTDLRVSDPGTSGVAGTVEVVDIVDQNGDRVFADVPPGTCLSSAHPTAHVAISINRIDPTPARAVSVTFHLSPELAVGPGGLVEGDYFSRVGGTQMFVTGNGGGSYTADCAIFGPVCGATGGGMLFDLEVARAAGATGSSTGEVVIDAVELRDCSNAPLVAEPGASALLSLSSSSSLSPTVLSASQVRTGNPPGGTTAITLSWTAVGDDGTVDVYRKGFGNYPLYDNAPNAGSVPTAPSSSSDALSNGWVRASCSSGACSSTSLSLVDQPSSRDFYYYVAFVHDACGNESPCSNLTPGTLDYHLGDVSDGVAQCVGDNHVDLADVTFLGGHYGVSVASNPLLTCLDIGPTTDHSVLGRPLTDGKIGFEELVLFAINFSVVSAPEGSRAPIAAAANTSTLAAPPVPGVGGTFDVGVLVEGAGNVQAMSVNLDYDHSVLEQVAVSQGDLLSQQGRPGMVLSSGPGDVDVALLGTGAGLSGRGEVARVTFRVKSAGDPRLTIAGITARDAANEPVSISGSAPVTTAPTHTALAFAFPNPFASSTEVRMSLRNAGPATLGVYDVAGRRVRVLVQGSQPAGARTVSWDGRDDSGMRLAPGAYVMRLEANGLVESRTVRLVR